MAKGTSKTGTMMMIMMMRTATLMLLLMGMAKGQALTTTTTNGVPAGTLQRTGTKQILAALNTPNTNANAGAVATNGLNTGASATATQIFMTSQSGTFAAMLVRTQSAAGVAAGGLGTDFCYVDVINTASQQSIWESPCQSVSYTDTCILLLNDHGLAIADGSNELWNNGAGNDYVNLVLLENGDLRMLDSRGRTVWDASGSPLVNQNCGTALSPGTPSLVRPAFASPLRARLPNGQNVFSQPFAAANPFVSAAPAARFPVPLFSLFLVPPLLLLLFSGSAAALADFL